ncbi:hypothetical protein NIES593_07345 [Hydrococcus rivularis NIES-593]|uniref:Uncharacterized protein n=1 Tax=Hydrococcus rivularis NIES-593 TaxID=1921803 RepID=A0A1U7HLL5_9CYAN|nr:hypothetical protein [Hydrococcus rivularis]OKH24483.1 hypothetical protein NIES593_07345 [Hydrococcus rivularis NIES-593]
MTNDNLLNRLRKNRQRTVVPKRDDALVAPTSEAQTGERLDGSVQNDLQPDERDNTEPATSSTNATLEQLKAELAKFPSTRRRSAIVLEEEIDQKLTRFCKERGVTVETFLEAVWEVASDDEMLLEQIVRSAKHRYISRKEAGRLRRLITMLSKT